MTHLRVFVTVVPGIYKPCFLARDITDEEAAQAQPIESLVDNFPGIGKYIAPLLSYTLTPIAPGTFQPKTTTLADVHQGA